MASPPFRAEKLDAKQTDEGVLLRRAAGVVSPYSTASVVHVILRSDGTRG